MRIAPWPIRPPSAAPRGLQQFSRDSARCSLSNPPHRHSSILALNCPACPPSAQVINNFEKRAIPAPPAEEKALLGRGRPLELLLGDEGPSLQVQSSLASH